MTERVSEYREILDLLRPISRLTKIRLVTLAFLGAVVNLLDFVALLLLVVLVSLLFERYSGDFTADSAPMPNLFERVAGSNFEFSDQILGAFALLVVLLLLSRSLLSLAISYASHRVAASATRQVGTALFSRLMRSPRIASDSTITNDQKVHALVLGASTGISNALAASLGLISDGFLTLLLIGFILTFDPWLALVTAAFLFVIFFAQNRLFAGYMRRIIAAEVHSQISTNTWLNEVFRLYPELYSQGLSPDISKTFGTKVKDQATNTSMKGFVISVPRQTFDIIVIIGATLLIASQILSPLFDVVLALTVVVFVIFRVLPALLRVQNYLLSLAWAVSGSRATRDLWRRLEFDSTILLTSNRLDTTMNKDRAIPVRFNGVSFSYPLQIPVVTDISFELGPKSLNVLSGQSGAGKSTLIALILGFLDPNIGSVEVFGENPSYFYSTGFHEAASARVAYMPQRPQAMAGSLRDNIICYRDLDFDKDFVWQCIEQAGLLATVQTLPQGLETKLEEFGSGFSGGEMQRLTLARALFGKPKFLILDEPFSSLDIQLEEDLSKTLIQLSKSMCVLVATHKSRFFSSADKYLHLDRGTIRIETNNPDLRQVKAQ